MTSIRRFLLIAILATLATVTGLSALWSYLSSRHEIDEMFDAQLAQYARILRQSLTSELSADSPLIIKRAALPPHSLEAGPNGHKYEAKIAFQVRDDQNRLLACSDNACQLGLDTLAPGYRTIEHAGKYWLVFILHAENEKRWYLVADRIDIRNELSRYVAMQTIVPILLVAPLTVFFILLILRHGLSPLSVVAYELARRPANDLSPVTLPKIPRELALVIRSINDLLSRLDQAFERERHFSADAAHELRTPIAALRLAVENALHAPESAPTMLPGLLKGLEQLSRIVEQLLTLSRLEPSHVQQHPELIDIGMLCQDTVGMHIDSALARQQDISLHIHSNARIFGNSTTLQILLRNLLQNAIQYSPPGGHIELHVSSTPTQAIIDVIDSGPGIPAEYRERVFDRFYRLHGDQHASSQTGSGLGMAIAQKIVHLHHGTIELRDPPRGTGLNVHILLPLCPEPGKNASAAPILEP